jgi:hypothetical protein
MKTLLSARIAVTAIVLERMGRNRLVRSHLNRVIAAFIVLVFCGLTASRASAGGDEITLEWDPNPEPNVAGYKLYYGVASGTYTRILDAGNATSVAVPDMISNFTYYFAVTAYSSDGLESAPSEEVSYSVPPPTSLRVEYVARGSLPIPLPAFPEIQLEPPGIDGKFAFKVIAPARTALAISASPDLKTWVWIATVTNPTGGIRVSDLHSMEPQCPCRYYKARLVDLSGLTAPD